MQEQRRQVETTVSREQDLRRPYERPAVIYSGRISIRAGSPVREFGPPSGPDSLFNG